MVATRKTIQDEIAKRLGLKGMNGYESFIKPTASNAKPVQAEVGQGSVVPMGNTISKEQATANFKSKTGAGEESEAPRDVLEVAKNIMNPQGGNMAEHDEDVDNLIYAIGSYFPGEAIAKAAPLLRGLIAKLGAKKFTPEVVDSAISKGFKSSKLSNLDDDAMRKMGMAAHDQDVNQYEYAHKLKDMANKSRDSVTPAYERGYGSVPLEKNIIDDQITIKGKTYSRDADYGWYSRAPGGKGKVPNNYLNKKLGGSVWGDEADGAASAERKEIQDEQWRAQTSDG